jgi:hypothetical protein
VPEQFAQQPPPYQQGQPRPPKRRRGVIWVVVAAVFLVIAVPAGIFGYRAVANRNNDPSAQAPHGQTIEPGQPVTAQTLAAVDPATFFEGVAKRQMTQPLARYLSATFDSQQKFLKRSDLWTTVDAAIDHKTNKWYYAQMFQDTPADTKPTTSFCVGAQSYSWNYYANKWQVVPFDSPECTKKPSAGTGDALFASSLTPAQADTVLSKLRSYQGYMNPAKPTLITSGGKSYIREVVDFKPIILADLGYGGTAISMWAFRDAGEDPVSWPWSNPYALGVGIHAVYYLDPKTLLPVAAFQKGIPAPANGDEPAIPAPQVQVINYSFPKTLPKPVIDNKPHKLLLWVPEGWKVQ